MSAKDYMFKVEYPDGVKFTVERDSHGRINFISPVNKGGWFTISDEKAKELVAFLLELIAEKEKV